MEKVGSYRFFLIPVIFIYLFFALVLLTKDPAPYTDEVVFSNSAYRILHSDEFGEKPFKKQFTLVNRDVFALYGPLYILSLSIPLKLFGYSIYSVRLFSVFVGLLNLGLLYLIIKQITDKYLPSLLGVLLLGIDMNFLRSVRFGRPEILVGFFSMLAFFYYVINYKSLSRKKYLILGLLLSLGFFTHYLLGLIAILAISCHIILNCGWKKFFKTGFVFLVAPFSILSVLWILVVLQSAPPEVARASKALIFSRLVPNFFILRVVLKDRLTYNNLTFLLYFLSFIVFLLSIQKDKLVKSFWLLGAIFSFLLVFWGSVFFYAGLVPVFFLPLVVLSLRTQKSEKAQQFNISQFIVVSFIILSIFQQMRLWGYYRNYSYSAIGQKVAGCIPKGDHNVLLTHAMPDDPYFYLAANRPDLKLAYTKYHEKEEDYMRKYLPKADFAVVYGTYAEVVEKELAKEQVKRLGLEPFMAELLSQYADLRCRVYSADGKYSKIAVFKIKHR